MTTDDRAVGGDADFCIGLLGPVVAERSGRLLPLAGPKQRGVLAALALQPGRVVSVDALIAAVWGEDPAAGAAKTLQVYVANLRRALETARAPGAPPTVLLTREPGYLLDVTVEQVDGARFEWVVDRARALVQRGELREAAGALRDALGDWRGTALAGLESLPIHDRHAGRFRELRLDALELCCGAELDLGLHSPLVPELEALVDEAPYRERLRALLIRALYASGRQRDALSAFQQARRTLVEDLGVEPGPELQDLERRVLTQDPSLDVMPPTHAHHRVGPDEPAVRKRVSVVAAGSRAASDPRAVNALVGEHGGTVIERHDDTVVVAFGVPRLGVDDVDRAATLALALQRDGLSAGVATGVASAAGVAVSGAPIGRAMELAAGSSPGRASIDATTRELLGGRATVEPAGRGTFTLLSLSPLPPGIDDTGPFVGRDQEMELLTSAWHTIARAHRPGVVTLVGEAGAGASRLAAELAARVEAPVLRVVLDPTVAADHVLEQLSSAPNGSIVLLEHVHRSARTASWALSRWADGSSDRAVLCIATATPELRAAAPAWPGLLPLALTLDIPPLDDDAARRLAAHLLGDEVVGERAGAVAAIAGGNPLFVSELAQHMSAVTHPPPQRLTAFVAARVDRIGAAARGTLEALAVLGGHTNVGALGGIESGAVATLDELVSARLLTVDDDGGIAMHEVVADVVMSALTDERAVDLHERAADAAPSLTARAAHLELAASRSPAGGGGRPTESRAVGALCELTWRTWSRGDIESAVDAAHRALGVASRADIDLVASLRNARRALASELVAGRLGAPRGEPSLQVMVGAWDAGRPVEQDLVHAARSLAATSDAVAQRDRCEAVANALSPADAADHGSSASSSA